VEQLEKPALVGGYLPRFAMRRASANKRSQSKAVREGDAIRGNAQEFNRLSSALLTLVSCSSGNVQMQAQYAFATLSTFDDRRQESNAREIFDNAMERIVDLGTEVASYEPA
jgi:hypothetical protein